MENLWSRSRRLFKKNVKKKKDKEWSRIGEKGFGNHLYTGKVLAHRVSVMKTTPFNRVR